MVRIRAFGTRDHDSNCFCSVCTLDLNNLNREIQLGLSCQFLQTISTVLISLSKDDKKALSGRLGEGLSDMFSLYLRFRARWCSQQGFWTYFEKWDKLLVARRNEENETPAGLF